MLFSFPIPCSYHGPTCCCYPRYCRYVLTAAWIVRSYPAGTTAAASHVPRKLASVRCAARQLPRGSKPSPFEQNQAQCTRNSRRCHLYPRLFYFLPAVFFFLPCLVWLGMAWLVLLTHTGAAVNFTSMSFCEKEQRQIVSNGRSIVRGLCCVCQLDLLR